MMGDNTRAILSIFACISSIRKLEVSYFFGINIQSLEARGLFQRKGRVDITETSEKKFNIDKKMPRCTPGTSSEHFFFSIGLKCLFHGTCPPLFLINYKTF